MRPNLSLFILMYFVVACRSNQESINSPDVLLDIDTEFSAMSRTSGRNKAFITYAHDDVVLLRPNGYPIEGKSELLTVMKNIKDENYSLTWKPEQGMISSSGDLGFTYGIYTLNYKADTIPDTQGTYVTIWKKDSQGNWKFVLDAGNEGLGHDEILK